MAVEMETCVYVSADCFYILSHVYDKAIIIWDLEVLRKQ